MDLSRTALIINISLSVNVLLALSLSNLMALKSANNLHNKSWSKYNSYLLETVFKFRTRTAAPFNTFLPFFFYNQTKII